MLVDSLINGALSVGTTLMGNVAAKNQQKREQKFNAEQAQINRDWQTQEREATQDWNLAQWQRENEYNAASAQYERLLETGMNPATALSMISGADNTAGSVQSSAQPGTPAQATGSIASSIGQNISNLGQSFWNNQSIIEDINNKRLDNDIKRATKQDVIDLAHTNLQQAATLLEGYAKDNQLKDRQIIAQDLLNVWQELDNKEKRQMLDWKVKQAKADYKLTKMKISTEDITQQFTLAQKGLIPAQNALILAQAYYNRQMGKHAGDVNFSQFLTGILDNAGVRDLVSDKIKGLVNKVTEMPPVQQRKYMKKREKAYDAYASGKVTKEQYEAQLGEIDNLFGISYDENTANGNTEQTES